MTDSISVTGDGIVSGNKATLKNVGDEVTYSINVKRNLDGTLQKYNHYIPIPKISSEKDVFQVQNDVSERFDFALTEEVKFDGNDIFEALYAVAPGASFNSLENDASITWYTYENLLSSYTLSDVTAVRIKLKNDRTVTTNFNTNIHLKMKSSNEENHILTGAKNVWKSRAYYKFSYNSGTIGTYYLTSGCETEVAFETVNADDKDAEDEEVEDSPFIDNDDVSGYDETPDTSDNSDYKKWIMYMMLSASAFVICQMKCIRKYFIDC